ncbi:MAG: molybdopterin molybdotransferase MoeA [Candidatus Bathyarchaeia archaeon]
MSSIRMKGFKETMKVDDSLRKFLKEFKEKKLDKEVIDLKNSLNRILAEDIVATIDIPPFDRAAMDGYAVKAEDTYGAFEDNPIRLKLLGRIEAGEMASIEVHKGEAVEIATGAPIPKGANAVEMVEYTRKIDDRTIEVFKQITPSENVSKIGEDVKKGDLLLKTGVRLKPYDLGMLASLGISRIKVFKRLRVGVLSTGSELVELGAPLEPGKIINSNRIMISAMVEELGGIPVDLGIAGDSLDEIKNKLIDGLKKSDLIIITGGTSVGEKDLVAEAINSIGKPGMIVHGVSIRPGMPTGLAIVEGKPIASLSGYPVAAIVGFIALVRPIIIKMLNTNEEPLPRIKATMSRRIASPIGVKSFVRVLVEKVGDKYFANPLRTTGSGVLSSLVKANGILIIPENKEGVDTGEEVEVILTRHIEE